MMLLNSLNTDYIRDNYKLLENNLPGTKNVKWNLTRRPGSFTLLQSICFCTYRALCSFKKFSTTIIAGSSLEILKLYACYWVSNLDVQNILDLMYWSTITLLHHKKQIIRDELEPETKNILGKKFVDP